MDEINILSLSISLSLSFSLLLSNDVKTPKKMILTSEWSVTYPFAGQNYTMTV